jgi:hypothetical protein
MTVSAARALIACARRRFISNSGGDGQQRQYTISIEFIVHSHLVHHFFMWPRAAARARSCLSAATLEGVGV